MLRVSVVVAVLAVSGVGCDIQRKVEQIVKPVPVVMHWNSVYRAFGDNEVHATIRNTGGEGYVKLICTNADKTWTMREYFNRGEERRVLMGLTGCTNFRGPVHFEVVAD